MPARASTATAAAMLMVLWVPGSWETFREKVGVSL